MSKKSILIGCSIFCLTFAGMTGCGNASTTATNATASYDASGFGQADTTKSTTASLDNATFESESVPEDGSSDADTTLTADKIVYHGSISISTSDYDNSYKKLKERLNQYNAVLSNENYSISGHTRSNAIEVRVPADKFDTLLNSLSDIGNVTDSSTYADNITKTYLDAQARMNSYQTKVDRLNELLAKADTVTDITAIYTELSDAEYELESAKSQLLNMDIDVKYSYLTINLTDTHKYSETGILQGDGTYWSDVKYSILNSLDSFINFLGKAFIFLIYALPYFILGALGMFVVTKLRKKHTFRIHFKKQKKPDNKQPNNQNGES